MDDCSALMARAAQCRRLAATLLDKAAIQSLEQLALEFEDQAAADASDTLEADDDPLAPRYAISRVKDGWLVSRGGDRVSVRSTFDAARAEAVKLKAFDTAE